MSNTRKPRKAPLKSVPTKTPAEESSSYLTVNNQGQAEALAQRLNMLELEHFKQTAYAEEEEAMGNPAGAAEVLRMREQTEKRMNFVRDKLLAMGVQFGEPPTEEDTTEEGTADV